MTDSHSNNTYSNIASTIALIASILAVIFSWQQNSITKEHNRQSVKPILQLTPMVEGDGKRNGLFLSNVGLGPAIIKGFDVSTKMNSASGFESDQWDSILTAVNVKADCFATAWPTNNATVQVDGEVPLLSITNSANQYKCLPEMIGLVGGDEIKVKITYQSIYGDTFVENATTAVRSKTVEKLYNMVYADNKKS